VNHAPLRYVDPTGHQGEPFWSKIGKAIGSTKLGKALITSAADAWCSAARVVSEAAQGTAIGLQVATGNPLGEYRTSMPQSTDMTEYLLGQMNENANSGIAQALAHANSGGLDDKIGASLGWTALVKGGGPWDFKVEYRQRGMTEIQIAGGSYRYDIAANIHFGFVGRASGFSADALLNGAGIAQIMDGTSSLSFLWTRFDSPYDAAAVQVGIYLYDRYGNVPLTEDMLQEALQLFPWESLEEYEAWLLDQESKD
jgi:hypothetical protein